MNRGQNQTLTSKSELANRPSATPNARCPQGVGSPPGAQPLGRLRSHTPTEEPSGHLPNPNWGARDSTRARCAEEEVTEGGRGGSHRRRWPAFRKSRVGCLLGLAGVRERGGWGGNHGSGEAGVQSEPGSPRSFASSQLSGAGGTPRGAGSERKKAGKQGATHRGRRSAAALCLRPRRRRSPPGWLHQPWRGRAPAGSPTVRLGLEPRPRPHCPRRGSAPSPAPALARGPPPAAAGTAGAWATAPGTQLGTQTGRRPLLSSQASVAPEWTPGPRDSLAFPPGTCSSEPLSLLQRVLTPARVGGPLKARSPRKGWRDVRLSLRPRLELSLCFGSASSTKAAETEGGEKEPVGTGPLQAGGNLSGREPPLAEGSWGRYGSSGH